MVEFEYRRDNKKLINEDGWSFTSYEKATGSPYITNQYEQIWKRNAASESILHQAYSDITFFKIEPEKMFFPFYFYRYKYELL